MKPVEIPPVLANQVHPRPRFELTAASLQEQHRQVRAQLIDAILAHSLSHSLGAGWTTVLMPVEERTPMVLDRGFGRPVVRALYLYHPSGDADEPINLVVDIRAEPDLSDGYCLESHRDNFMFSTSALLFLSSALESDELRVDLPSCTFS